MRPVRLFLLLTFFASLLGTVASADELPPGFRWGISLAPSIVILSVPTLDEDDNKTTTRAVGGGVVLPAVRLGYQFERSGLLGVSVYAEPRLSIFSVSSGGSSSTIVAPVASAIVELDIGKHFFVAAGLSMGGEVVTGGGGSGRGPFMGGFALRFGGYIPLRSAKRPRALSVALEALALFGAGTTSTLDEEGDAVSHSGTTSMTSLGLSVGYDQF